MEKVEKKGRDGVDLRRWGRTVVGDGGHGMTVGWNWIALCHGHGLPEMTDRDRNRQ